jgi:uncharacterized membrane protein YraQ (UPF0718 family)
VEKNNKKKGKGTSMVIPTVILGVLAVVLLYIGYAKGQGQYMAGLKFSLNVIIPILLMLVLAFIVAGVIQVLIQQELLAKWIGTESGWFNGADILCST